MFDLFPQQNFCDMLKSTAFRGSTPAQRAQTMAAIKRLENARVWDAPTFAQAIDQVRAGAIWADAQNTIHVEGRIATLERIVDTYLELTGEAPVREVL